MESHLNEPAADAESFVRTARALLTIATQLPTDEQCAAARQFGILTREWLEQSTAAGRLDPVGYERLVDRLDHFPSG